MTQPIQYGTIANDGTNAPNAIARMTPDEIRAHNAQIRADHLTRQAQAQKAEAEARQKRLDDEIASSIANNPQLNGSHRGHRATVAGGEISTTPTRPQITGATSFGYMATDALTIPIRVSGIELTPAQAKTYLADGSISPQQYSEAVTEAMQVYRPGYRHSFR